MIMRATRSGWQRAPPIFCVLQINAYCQQEKMLDFML